MLLHRRVGRLLHRCFFCVRERPRWAENPERLSSIFFSAVPPARNHPVDPLPRYIGFIVLPLVDTAR